MTEQRKKMLIAAAACAGAFMVGSLTLSGITLYNQMKVNTVFNRYFGEYEDVAQEDNVMIAGEYEIKSTLPISDAYRSGDDSKLSDRDKETLDMARQVIDKVITEEMTPYEKEIAIYKYLTKDLTSSTGMLTVINNDNTENYEPHDVLKNRSAVCVGYATTFRMFMQMLDIECMVVHNTELGHSWNLIKLDDGCWYHTDCYSDSGSSNFMNFNMDDQACLRGHDWNRDFFPAATGTKYNYILSICEEIGNIYSIPKWVMEAVKAEKTVISCTFKTEITEELEPAANYMAEEVQNQLMNGNKVYDATAIWARNTEGQYVLCYYLEYEDDDYGVDEKTRTKIDDKIYETFDKYGFFDWDEEDYEG